MMLLPAIASIVGFFSNRSSDWAFIVSQFIVPPFFGIGVACLWRRIAWFKQLGILMGLLMIQVLVGLANYCIESNGWHYITTDSETQLWIVALFMVQVVVGIAGWGATKGFQRIFAGASRQDASQHLQ